MAGRKQALLILLLLPLLIFMVSEEEEHASSLMEFVGKTVNFIILFGGLAYLLFKPIRDFLERRSEVIIHSIKEAEESRTEAEKRLEEVKVRLAGLEDEIAKIKKEAEIEGRKEEERIQKLAQEERERIKNFTKQEIELLTKAGIQELKEHTAELAVKLAQGRIQEKLTPEYQSLLIDKSIERLEKTP